MKGGSDDYRNPAFSAGEDRRSRVRLGRRMPPLPGSAKQSFADARYQTEFGNEGKQRRATTGSNPRR